MRTPTEPIGAAAALGYARAPSGRSALAPSDSDTTSRRSNALLALGAALGLAVAAWGLLEERRAFEALPEGVVARVGERSIRRVDYERVLAGVASDRRGPVDAAIRRRVLERMVDEELLVQRALGLGLAGVDRRVRGELTSGLIDSIVAETDAEEPSSREVEAHYRANVDFFTRPGRLRARSMFFSPRGDARHGRPAAERAADAGRRLTGGHPDASGPAEWEVVEAALADSQVSPIPNALLPATKIRDYAGPSAVETLMALEVGETSAPLAATGGWRVVQLLEREAGVVPALDDVRELVRQDLRRRRGDEALRRYLEELRGEIPVAMDESLFAEAAGSNDAK